MKSWGGSRLQAYQVTMVSSVWCSVSTVLSLCVILQPGMGATSTDLEAGGTAPRRRMLPFLRARLDPVPDLLIDDADALELGKRQFDDYGHMRFGKRGDPEDKFDDYGHMRFGRGHV